MNRLYEFLLVIAGIIRVINIEKLSFSNLKKMAITPTVIM